MIFSESQKLKLEITIQQLNINIPYKIHESIVHLQINMEEQCIIDSYLKNFYRKKDCLRLYQDR